MTGNLQETMRFLRDLDPDQTFQVIFYHPNDKAAVDELFKSSESIGNGGTPSWLAGWCERESAMKMDDF